MAGLTPFYNTFNDPKTIKIACIGDSTTFGTSTTGTLGWPGALRSLAAARWGTGSDGLHTRDRNITLTTSADAWTKATTSDAWDRSPCLAGVLAQQATYLANGSTKIATWTKPAALTVNGFYIWAVDGASSGNFSYSLDGGSSWTNVSQTWTQGNSIKRIFVGSNVTGTNTVKVRAANAAGTAVNCYFMGIEPTTTTSTYVIQNWGAASENTGSFVRTSSGNWHEALDLLQPQLLIFMMTNDEAITAALGGDESDIEPNWRPLIESLADVVTGYGGSMLFMNFFEQTGRSVTMQATYRALIKTIAAEYGMPCIDFYDLVGDYQASVDAGYVNATDIHPNDTGAAFMAQQVWKVIGKSNLGARTRV